VVLYLSVPFVEVVVGLFIWYVSTAYFVAAIGPSSHMITLVSRFVVLVTSVMSVPFVLVFMFGLAGVHPVLSCSFMMVAWHPLLCMVSLLSNTLSGAVFFGVSLIVSRIGCWLCCCIVRLVCVFLVRLLWV